MTIYFIIWSGRCSGVSAGQMMGLGTSRHLGTSPDPTSGRHLSLRSLHLAPLWQAGEGAGEGPGHREGWKAWHVEHREQCSGEGDGESGSGRASERGTQMTWAQLPGAQGVGRSHFIVIRNSLILLQPSRGRGYPRWPAPPLNHAEPQVLRPDGANQESRWSWIWRRPILGAGWARTTQPGQLLPPHTHLRAGHASVAFPASHERKSQQQLWGRQTGPTAAIVLY